MYINKSGFEFDTKPGVFKNQKHFMRSIIRVKLLLHGIFNIKFDKVNLTIISLSYQLNVLHAHVCSAYI